MTVQCKMLFLSVLPLLAFGLVCFAYPLEKRQSTSTDSFKLYAYGSGISGLPVFYRNGMLALPNLKYSSID